MKRSFTCMDMRRFNYEARSEYAESFASMNGTSMILSNAKVCIIAVCMPCACLLIPLMDEKKYSIVRVSLYRCINQASIKTPFHLRLETFHCLKSN